MNDEIRKIAENVHRWALRNREKLYGLCGTELRGMCGIASWELFKRLKKEGYDPIVCINSSHAFVRLGKYIIDVTSKQFNRKAIEILPICDVVEYFWKIERTAKSKKGMRMAQKNWQGCQKHPDIRKTNVKSN